MGGEFITQAVNTLHGRRIHYTGSAFMIRNGFCHPRVLTRGNLRTPGRWRARDFGEGRSWREGCSWRASPPLRAHTPAQAVSKFGGTTEFFTGNMAFEGLNGRFSPPARFGRL
eukprot:441545-Prorocentrum_minimum.AAC.1